MIKILIISSEAHEEFHMSVAEAVDFIKDSCANRGKWAFFDGDYFNPDNINETNIQEPKEIMLTNALVAG